MKKFFNIPYDEDDSNDLYRKIQAFNSLLEKLIAMYNLTGESKALLIQMFLNGASLEKISNMAKSLKFDREGYNKQMIQDEKLYRNLSAKYHISLEKAKMVAHLLTVGIPFDTILVEVDKIDDSGKVEEYEFEELKVKTMPEPDKLGTGLEKDDDDGLCI